MKLRISAVSPEPAILVFTKCRSGKGLDQKLDLYPGWICQHGRLNEAFASLQPESHDKRLQF